MSLSIAAKLADHLTQHDAKGRRRASRSARWYAIAALSALALYAIPDYVASGYRWYLDINTHMAVHQPEAVKRFEALEAKVDHLGTGIGELKSDVRDIRNALMARQVMVMATPKPEPWFSWAPVFMPSATAGEIP